MFIGDNMNRKLGLTGLFAVFVAAGLLFAADEKKDPPVKGQLPPNWKQLGLSDTQKNDVYAIQADYHGKIQDLESQIKKLRDEEHNKLLKVLTEDQKKHLRELKDPTIEKGSSASSGSGSTSNSTAPASSSKGSN